MTQDALKKMYQLLLTEPHAPTVCAQLERIAREALVIHHPTKGNKMKSRTVFMALMRGRGYTLEELEWNGSKFIRPAMQTRWGYFLMGWEMRGTQSTETGG